MNWKNSLILLCLVSSVATADAKYYQTYQRLQMQLQNDPAATLVAIELFENQVLSADSESQQMALYLHLQACIALNCYSSAARSVERLLELNQQADRQPDLLKLSAQLHYQLQQYKTVVARVDGWLASSEQKKVKPSIVQYAELYSLKAYSLYSQQHLRTAVNAMERAISYQTTEERQQFLLGLYQQMDDWPKANQVLKQLVTQFIYKTEYWEKYAYSFLKLGQDKQALNALGSAYKSNRLPQRSIMLYAQLLLRYQAPHRATQVLEAHPKLASHPSYSSLLSQSYLLSRDRQKAAEWLAKSEQKNSFATQGLLAYQQGQWQKAIKLFSHLDESKKNNQYWYLLAAISEFELKRWPAAHKAFERLAGTQYDELSKQWLSQINYLTHP